MLPMIYLVAFGEGRSGATASGIFLGLVLFVISLVAFGVYAYRTYPVDQK